VLSSCCLDLDFRVRPFSRADRRPGLLLNKERSPHSSTPGFGLFIARSPCCVFCHHSSCFRLVSRSARPKIHFPCSLRWSVLRATSFHGASAPADSPAQSHRLVKPPFSCRFNQSPPVTAWVCHPLAYLCLVLIQESTLASCSVLALCGCLNFGGDLIRLCCAVVDVLL
jgi:hypothetical protein